MFAISNLKIGQITSLFIWSMNDASKKSISINSLNKLIQRAKNFKTTGKYLDAAKCYRKILDIIEPVDKRSYHIFALSILHEYALILFYCKSYEESLEYKKIYKSLHSSEY